MSVMLKSVLLAFTSAPISTKLLSSRRLLILPSANFCVVVPIFETSIIYIIKIAIFTKYIVISILKIIKANLLFF